MMQKARSLYIYNLEVVKKGAKLWEASNTMIPIVNAKMLISLKGDSLIGKKVDLVPLAQKYHLSLVCWVFSAFGEPHVKSFVDPWVKEFLNIDSNVGLIQLNIEEKRVKMPFLWALKPWIKAQTPQNRRENYLMCYQDIADARMEIGITNSVLGWVTLVDRFGRIRWIAHGIATEEEINSLLSVSKILQKDSN